MNSQHQALLAYWIVSVLLQYNFSQVTHLMWSQPPRTKKEPGKAHNYQFFMPNLSLLYPATNIYSVSEQELSWYSFGNGTVGLKIFLHQNVSQEYLILYRRQDQEKQWREYVLKFNFLPLITCCLEERCPTCLRLD